jgi:hypothetical protein
MNLFKFIEACVTKAPDVVLIVTKTDEEYTVQVSARLRHEIDSFDNGENFFLHYVREDDVVMEDTGEPLEE